jgi:hypothetical protein
MSEWRQLLAYCANCDSWADALPHRGCARPLAGDVVFDPEECLLACTACSEVWLADDTEATCPACGHGQAIGFSDTPQSLHSGDQLLASDGTVVYVLLQSGSLLITHRSYI